MKQMNSCGSGSCGSCNGSRSFLTKDEKIGMLKDYQKSIEKEAKGIAERISELENDK